jgi:hypothetical protein
VAFYAGVLATFDYGFQFNALFTVLYLLPCERWITTWVERRLPGGRKSFESTEIS